MAAPAWAPAAAAVAGGVAVLAVAAWHFLRDNLDEQRSRVGSPAQQKWCVGLRRLPRAPAVMKDPP